jgi:hypothetical protein
MHNLLMLFPMLICSNASHCRHKALTLHHVMLNIATDQVLSIDAHQPLTLAERKRVTHHWQ